MEKQATRYGRAGAAIGALLGITPSLIDLKGEEDKEKKKKALKKALVHGIMGAGAGMAAGEVYGFGRHPLKSLSDFSGLTKKLDDKDSFISKTLINVGLKEKPKPKFSERVLNKLHLSKKASLAGTVNYAATGALIGGLSGGALNYLKQKKQIQQNQDYEENPDAKKQVDFNEAMRSALTGAGIGAGAGIATKAVIPMYYKGKAKKLYEKNITQPLRSASKEWDIKKSEKNLLGKMLMGSKKRYLKKVERNLPHTIQAKALAGAKWDAKYDKANIFQKLTMKKRDKVVRDAEKMYTNYIPQAIGSMKPFSDYSRAKYKNIKKQF